MDEIWKSIINYENLYEVSNYGRIKSFPRQGSCGGILKSIKHNNGYLGVGLFKNGIRKDFLVHRLVLETFIGPCPKGKEGCHNDGNKENNFIGNLRWDTKKENCKDRKIHGNERNQNGSKNNMAKLNDNKIREIIKLHLEGKSNTEIAKIFNVSQPNVSLIVNRKTWKHIN